MNPINLPSIDTQADEHNGRADAHSSPDDSADSASDLAGMYDDQDLASMGPPEEPEPLRADGLQDEDHDVPRVGLAGELVTTKGRSTQSDDSKEKP